MKYLIPVLIILAALIAAVLLIGARPQPVKEAPEPPSVLVQVEALRSQAVTFQVRSQGSVVASTQTTMVTEVPGRVVEVAPALVAGGKFRAGEMLVRIDPSNFESELRQARAALKKAETQVATENALAGNALKDWQRLRQSSAATTLPSDLALRKPQLAEAVAEFDSRKAALERAERNLERTTIRAPYQGLVRQKLTDLGQFLNVGAPVAEVFATDRVEVRLPLTPQDLQFVDLSRLEGGGSLPVQLTATIGGELLTWSGRVTRSEGVFDERSRVLYLVAEVTDPYNLAATHPQLLRIGTFVTADIEGRSAGDLFVVPRHTIDSDDRLWIVDDNQQLQPRIVEVRRRDERFAYISGSLSEGELLCLTPVNRPLPGMIVRFADDAEVGPRQVRTGTADKMNPDASSAATQGAVNAVR